MEIAMKKILLSAVALTFAGLAGAPAHAQATRTWVSGTGDDSLQCSRTAPCKTFAGALSKTTALGEINCLDTGGFSSVNITKEITIDCTGVLAGILNAGTIGVTVNVPGGAVTLRGMTINGTGTGTIGLKIVAASKVNLEDVAIFGNAQLGVSDARGGAGGVLVIRNSTIRNNAGAGIGAVAASGNGMVLENVVSKQNLYGIAIATGNTAIITGSSFTNNVTAGIQADGGAAIHITDSMMAFNGTGAQINGSASMANNSVMSNTTGLGGGGPITSFGNNRVFANGSAGQAVVAAGAASTDLGQK
jgi:hypothetical protein